jgi:Y-X(10)_GDL-associated radical SAM protein
MPVPPRSRNESDYQFCVPVHVVWELTLACDLKCHHCGSRAGKPRVDELTTSECLEVVEALAHLGTREISLIGGEAYLRKDWTEIVRAITRRGIYCAVQTGGRNMTAERLAAGIDAGLGGIGVSIDGLEELHDRQRGFKGSYHRAFGVLESARLAGLHASVNTQIGPETMDDLPELMERLIATGVRQWQIQLTVAMGNAVDNPGCLLQPYQLLELMPLLARLYREGVDRGLLMVVGNNIGFFGPYEHLWRGFGDESIHWSGCGAGHTVLGIESDGTIKACPSLPASDYGGGNVRNLSADRIWRESPELKFRRTTSPDRLWGFCRACYYADVCSAGCTWTAHSLLGRPGNNPYCHYRALEMDKQGLRERIVKIRDADSTPFAIGEFELRTERISDGSIADVARSGNALVRLAGTPQSSAIGGEQPRKMDLCRSCNCYIWQGEENCHHCGESVRRAQHEYALAASRRQDAIRQLAAALRDAGVELTPG